jgi:hypothetical protein
VYGCTVRRSIADANRSCNAAHWTGVSRASRSRTRVDLLGDEQPPIAPAQQDIGICDTVADDQRHHRIGIVGRSGIGRRGGAGRHDLAVAEPRVLLSGGLPVKSDLNRSVGMMV